MMKTNPEFNTKEDYWTKTSKLMHSLQRIKYKVNLH